MKKHKIDYDRDFTHQDENVKEAILNEVSAQTTYLTMQMIRKFPALKVNAAKSVDSLRALIGDIVQNKRQMKERRKPGPKRRPGRPCNPDKGRLSDGSRSQ